MPCETGGGDDYTMPVGVVASTHSEGEWEPREKDLKRYIHFDRDISAKRLKIISNDADSVASHAFFPLLRFYEDWTKFRKGGKRVKKSRPLRYASRIDAAIYARYRAKLSLLYEAELQRRRLLDVPVAYRRIPKSGGGNMSNIEIARDVFAYIRQLGDCVVTVVDIKSYFESLDHERIKSVWEKLLGSRMPADHLAVFKALTKYSIVDVDRLFARLKLNDLVKEGSRDQRRMRNIDVLKASGFKQICSTKEFRELVAGSGAEAPSLIQKNGFAFGIPQGTPLSDIVANFYLIDFDEEMNAWVESQGGIYRRYSDDIIVVLPRAGEGDHSEAKNFLQKNIRKYGKQLRIQDRKVCVVGFQREGSDVKFTHLSGHSSRNGLEYLGFQYNGKNVKIKSSTLSNAWRKLKRRAYGYASRFVKRFRGKGRQWMEENYPRMQLETKILRDVTYNQDLGFETWTFVKYVRRASRSFVGFSALFSQQTKRYRKYARLIIAETFNRALEIYS